MRYLRTNTATRITVGPFLDKTDGITPEVALTVTNEKLTLMVDTAGVPTLVLDTAPTTSTGSNDMAHVTGDDAGFYDLELAAADVNYLGRAMLALTDAATHCPVFHEFMIVPAMVYDSLILGTDLLDTENSAGVATMVADYARRTGDYATVGAKMDIADAPSATGVGVIVSAIWDKLLTGIAQAGSVGKLIKDYLDAAISTRSTYAGGDTSGVTTMLADYARRTGDYATAGAAMDLVDTLKNKVGASGYDRTTDSLEALGDKTSLDAAGVRTAVGLASANLDTQLGDLPTAAENGAAVLVAAAAAPIAADVKKINNTTVAGDGNATPWGP